MRFTLSLSFFLLCVKVIAQDLSLKQGLERIYDQPDSAEFFLEEARKQILNRTDSGLYFYFKGEARYLQGEDAKGKNDFLKSLEYLDPDQDPNFVSFAYIRLTRAEQTLGQFENALEFAQAGIKHAQYSQDSNSMAYHLLDIAVTYHDMESYQEGISYGKKALEVLDTYSKANPLYRAYALNSIAINFDDWGKADSALFYHYQVLDGLDQIDSVSVNFTFNNIGNTLLKQGKYSEARKWIETALGINRKLGNDPYNLSTNFTNLATISYNLGEWESARRFLDSAAFYVYKSESTEKRRDYLFEEYQFYKRRGNLDQALTYLERYSSLKDTIFKEDRIRMMGELETRYEVAQKEQELAESRASLAEQELIVKNRNFQLLVLLLVLVLILGASFFIYYRQKIRTRHLEQEAKILEIYAEQETQKRLQDQRNRIAAELHDNIGAQLTFIVSSLNHLKYADLSKIDLSAKIDQISDFTVETVNELRDTIWAMNKDAISLEDLQLRLAGLIHKAKEFCPQVEFELKLDEGLDSQIQLNSLEGINLYRIAQEALNNAIKHADAERIEVFITQNGDNQISLNVMDNGKGFDEKSFSGNGMSTMRSRAERIGKELKVESQPGSGTLISVG